MDFFDVKSSVATLTVAILIAVFLLSSNRKSSQCRKFGLPKGQKPPESPSSLITGPARIQSLWIYPVKSCQGIELARSRVIPTGLEFDRLFTFAQRREDGEHWEFVTQRTCALLANVEIELWIPDEGSQEERYQAGYIVMRFPGMGSGIRGLGHWVQKRLHKGAPFAQVKTEFTIPLAFPSDEDIKTKGYTFAPVKIWKEITLALNIGSLVPPELKTYLGIKHNLGLFRMDPKRQRKVFRCAPRKEDIGFQPVVDFHDAYPLHLLNLSSVKNLETKIEKDDTIESLDVRRFRANIIVTGAEEYDEETWKSIHVGTTDDGGKYHVSCRTVRCKLPNIDPDTGVKHRSEPDQAMRKYRDVDAGAPKWGCLGMQLCPTFQDSTSCEFFIETGMEVSILETGSHKYIPQ